MLAAVPKTLNPELHVAPLIPTTPSKSNDPVLSMGGPLGLPDSHPWGDASKWTFQPPDPQHVTAYRQLGCKALLHPKTVSGRLQLWKLRAIQLIAQRTAEPLGKRLMMDAATFGGSLLVYVGTLFLANRSPDPKHFFLKNPAIGLLCISSIGLGGAAFWKAFLDAFEASILSFLMHGTDGADIARLQRCQWLQHFQQAGWVHQSGGKAKEGKESQMITLPNDIGLGTAAVAGPALTTGGSGAVDWVMMGLAMVGAAIAAPEISIPRAIVALRSAAAAAF